MSNSGCLSIQCHGAHPRGLYTGWYCLYLFPGRDADAGPACDAAHGSAYEGARGSVYDTPASAGATLFVGDLPEHWTRHHLFDYFQQVSWSGVYSLLLE